MNEQHVGIVEDVMTYLGLDCSLHLEIIHVKTALRLLSFSSPTTRPLSLIAIATLHRAVPVTDAAVSLIKQFIAGDTVLRDVPFHKMEVPCEERVEFEETGAVDFQRLEVCTVSTLGCSATGYHSLDPEVFIRSASRFDLWGRDNQQLNKSSACM